MGNVKFFARRLCTINPQRLKWLDMGMVLAPNTGAAEKGARWKRAGFFWYLLRYIYNPFY